MKFSQLFSSLIAVFGLFFISGASAQVGQLPSSADYSFSVVNISQGNTDATQAAARPGDTLRYQVEITSDTEDVNQFVANIDISSVLEGADLIDSGLGTLSGSLLTFPPYSQKAPCNKKFTFFVRVKANCGELLQIVANANEVAQIGVNLACEKEEKEQTFTPQEKPKLTKVGPESATVFGFIIFLSILLVLQLSSRKKS